MPPHFKNPKYTPAKKTNERAKPNLSLNQAYTSGHVIQMHQLEKKKHGKIIKNKKLKKQKSWKINVKELKKVKTEKRSLDEKERRTADRNLIKDVHECNKRKTQKSKHFN